MTKKIPAREELKELRKKLAELQALESQFRRAEKGLAESARLYHTLVESLQEGLLVTDPDENIIFANPYFCTLIGRTRDELIGMNFKELMPAPDFETVRIKTGQRKKKGETEPFELTVQRSDGELRMVAVATAPWLNDQHEFQGTFHGLLDITDQKRAEEELRTNEAKYHAVMEQSADCIFIIDFKTKQLIEANRSFRDIFGYSPDELAVLNIYDIADGIPQDVGREWDILLKGRDSFEGERELYHRDGSVRQMWISASIITYRERVALCVVARDITERKKIQEDLVKSVKELKKTLDGAINTISTIVRTRDPYTADHQLRVSRLACAIGREMGLPPDVIEGLRTAALLHDVGKIYLPAELLAKPTHLTESEMSLIKNHPQDGYNILKKIKFPRPVAQIVLQHHERLDGSGYPLGITADEILLESKILGVADAVEAMIYYRPYRPPRGMDEAMREIAMFKGTFYDPEVVKICLRLFTKLKFSFDESTS